MADLAERAPTVSGFRRRLAPLLTLLASLCLAEGGPAAAAPDARPGTLRTFGDWVVGCDNGGRCAMVSLVPEQEEPPVAFLRLTREAGPDGAISIQLSPQDRENEGTVEVVAVDGREIAGRSADGGYNGALAETIARALPAGKSLAIRTAAGAGIVSLAGSSAALRYIDAEQGRAGGETAIVARGPAPASAVRPGPPLPTITALIPSGKAAPVSPAQYEAMRRLGGCDLDETSSVAAEPERSPLGAGKTLVLLPCSAGAYNLISAIFVVDHGKVAPAAFDAPSGFTAESGELPTVVNGSFDVGLLNSYAKGRGLGDCGVGQSFVWDGSRFRLAEQSEMNECRGNTDYIVTWRTTVVRR